MNCSPTIPLPPAKKMGKTQLTKHRTTTTTFPRRRCTSRVRWTTALPIRQTNRTTTARSTDTNLTAPFYYLTATPKIGRSAWELSTSLVRRTIPYRKLRHVSTLDRRRRRMERPQISGARTARLTNTRRLIGRKNRSRYKLTKRSLATKRRRHRYGPLPCRRPLVRRTLPGSTPTGKRNRKRTE